VKIKGIVWVGTATERFDETVRFFSDVMGLQAVHEREDLSVLRLESGEWIEVFGPRDPHFREFDRGPAVEFLVDDVAAARAELEAQGIEFLIETHGWGDYVWTHFRGPDGNVYGLTSGPYGER
jgi:catechol 2,3-dioxygenase-like lactoylglutathione lyase family enzyme